MTGDPAQDYFCDGIAEEIITSISSINELFVVARNSSFFYKGKPVKIKQISEELGVRYVMEGSVRSSGDKVRITAQLIDAVKGQHIWAKNYDHNFGNILKIQDDISLNIAQNLRIKLTDGEHARMLLDEYKNPEVFYKYSEAISYFWKYTKEDNERFGQLAREIVDIEPESPMGYRLLAWYHKASVELGVSPKKNLKKAFEYAKKTLSMDESNPFAHITMCNLYLITREYEKSITSGKRAVELQPSGNRAHMALGKTLCYAEHYDEAIVHCKQAIRLDPFPNHFLFYFLGLSYWANGQYEKALIEYKKAQQRAPDYYATHLMLSVIYSLLDREKEARKSAMKALELYPDFSVSWIKNFWRFKTQDNLPVFINAMRKAGFPEGTK
jgi:adenylate cyclase